MRYIKELIRSTADALKDSFKVSCELCDGFVYKECGYKSDNVIPAVDDSWKPLKKPLKIDNSFDHCWVVGKVTMPLTKEWEYCVLDLSVGNTPQTIAYIDGKMIQGLDYKHQTIILDQGKTYDVALYIYEPSGQMALPHVSVFDRRMEKAYFDYLVPFEAMQCLEENTYEYTAIAKHLEAAALMINRAKDGSKDFYDSVILADEYLENEFYGKECGKSPTVVKTLGHSHLDVAWTWTVDQTKEKAQRTFGSVAELMKYYPEYRFMSSQPQLFQFLKDEAPELYEEIKSLVAQGRIDVDGGMWLESDCNIPSGESFVRQLIYGKDFIKKEFGKDSKVLWLPDVFGYSAALPQILKKAGVDYFVTGKISWSDVNSMPHDSFYWRGIDGSEVFTHFFTTMDFDCQQFFPDATFPYVLFNGSMTPREVKSSYDVYRSKQFNSVTLHTFGYGDGGGGPTYQHMEKYRRLNKGIPGIPKTEMTKLSDFLGEVKDNFDNSCKTLRERPLWDGELYLEYHRGTYTTIGQVKRNNRKAEFALRKAEMLAELAKQTGIQYPQDEFDRMWKLVCLNQFHDIIPGSSIKQVYDRSNKEFCQVIDGANSITSNALAAIANNVDTEGGYLVYNMHSFENTGLVELDGKLCIAQNVPPMGYKVIPQLVETNSATVTADTIDNKYFTVKFAPNGFISSIYDKQEDRELLRNGEYGNRLVVYEDHPACFDAWEMSHYTRLKGHEMDECISIEPYDNGALKGITVTWRFMNSTVKEDIVVYDDIPRIDIFCQLDINDTHIILKALFPFDVRATKTTSEIQYGNVERPCHMNTSWDEARFETCMHKWVDVSDNGYGVSLLNDCKYGFSSYDNTLAITLVKCAESPFYGGDLGNHEILYSIYPHKNSAVCGGTVNQAYSLNAPMTAVKVTKQAGCLKDEYSAVKCNKDNIVVEVLKQAQNSSDTIVRFYDAHNMRTKATLEFEFPFKRAFITDLLENKETEIPVVNNSITVDVKNFEIVTVMLTEN